MNAKKTKKLRKQIYGDMSQRAERQLVYKLGHTCVFNRPDSLRAKYQAAKKKV